MTDIEALKKKFPTKEKDAAARAKKAKALKAIAREYELKKAELERKGPPMLKKGFVFYGIILLGMVLVGGLVVQQLLNPPPPPTPKAILKAQNSVNALAVALGRYRYHVGVFPTTAEGIAMLAARDVKKPGWNGPYIKEVFADPWGNPYVYIYNGETEDPTLFSMGSDKLRGTSDDILPAPGLFEKPFTDESWLKDYMPQDLRGKVVVFSDEQKSNTLARIEAIKHPEKAIDAENRVLEGTLQITVADLTDAEAKIHVEYETPKGKVANDFPVFAPHLWRPEIPILYDYAVGGKTYKYPIRVVETDEKGTLFLNGEKMSVKGVRLSVAPGLDRDRLRRQLEIVKDMGANAVGVDSAEPDSRVEELGDALGLLVLDSSDVPGAFTLAAFDYGTCTNGLCDALGFPKAGFYRQRALWNEADLTAQLFPHWTREGHEGEKIPVTCITSGDAAELFLNGESLGMRTKAAGDGALTWVVPYESGELKAIVYRKGSVIGESVERTAYKPVAVRLTPDVKSLDEDHTAFVKIEIVDDYGTVVPLATTELKLALEGKGEILGGAATCRAQDGRTGVFLRRNHGSGRPLRLTVTAESLRPATLLLPRR